MVERLVLPSNTGRTSHLPPAEFWLRDPGKKIETPTDSRGLVVVGELIEQVKAYVAPEYAWHLAPDVHHLYWPRESYVQLQASTQGLIPARTFREVCANKIYIPRDFHETIHCVSVPPPMPDAAVMQPYIKGWHIARSVFESVQEVIRQERLGKRRLHERPAGLPPLTPEQIQTGIQIVEEIVSRRGRGIERHLGELVLVPEEFRPIDIGLPLPQAVGQIGELVLEGWQRQTRAVRLSLAA